MTEHLIREQERRASIIEDAVLEKMLAGQFERHAWVLRAGEQIRRWKAEEEADAPNPDGTTPNAG